MMTIQEYVFTDLDNDGRSELVVLIESIDGSYVILRYNKKEEKVYGYVLGVRELEDLKQDGTFMGSGGAAISTYSKIEFDKNNKMNVIDLAYVDEEANVYKIDNKDVSYDEMNTYIEKWDEKKSVNWIKVIQENQEEQAE